MGGGEVIPAPLTRVPISSVTDGGGTTADSALILATPAARRNARMATTAASRDFRISIGAITGSGGALLYLDGAMNNASWATVVAEYSTAADPATFIPITITLFAPSGALTYGNRGQYALIPAAATNGIVKLTYQSSAGSLAFYVGLVNISSNPRENAIFAGTGTSYEQQAWTAVVATDQINYNYPAGDSLFFGWGRTGGQLSNDTIYNEAFSQSHTQIPFCAYWLVGPWSNQVYQVVRNSSPYIYAGDTSTAKADIISKTPQFKTYADANNIEFAFVSMTLADYRVNDPAAGAPAVDMVAASGGPFQEKGNAPYNQNEVFTAITTNSPDYVDTSLGICRLDAFSPTVCSWENLLSSGDGLHPNSAGANIHSLVYADFARKIVTGSWPLSWMERTIASYEGGGVPASVETRLTNAIAQWPAATTGAQTTARAALATRLAAISNTYVEPTLTGAAVLPTALVANTEWFDGSDFSKFLPGASGSVALTPATMDVLGVVRQVTSKGASASILENTTTATPAVRPLWIPNGGANGVRGVLDFASTYGGVGVGVVLNAQAGAPIIGSLDAGNSELLIGFIIKPKAIAKTWMTFTAGASNLRFGPAGQANYSKMRVIDTSTVIMTDPTATDTDGTQFVCFVVGVVAGAWFMDRNGAQVTTGSRTLSARTGSAFTLGTGSTGEIQDIVICNGAGAAAAGNRAALNAYLQQKSGAY